MNRIACWTIFFLFSQSLFHAPAQSSAIKIDTESEKYAAFVLDADTGEVFFEENADAKRYPASLTKMMTLYMTFEALRKGTLKMDQRLPVSKRAAAQPQTNISLKAGDTITVQDAMKALIVRSANDVAVVMAEALGDTEWNFARMMTAKARSLGMHRTQFRNPHGLPDRSQYTTARDMSKLAIALRRDFPQYYHLFKTKYFTWDGRTYESHNHVLEKFDGVDGIKTGYIRMSGFNLATSVKRDGYHMVAVVMGGQTSRARDNHMVGLLEDSFATIAERNDQPRAFAEAPVPEVRPDTLRLASANLPWKKPVKVAKLAERARQTASLHIKRDVPFKKDKPGQINASASKATNSLRFVSDPEPEQLAKQNTLDFQLADLSSGGSFSGAWGIQVGAFRDEQSALQAASKAVHTARDMLQNSKIRITDRNRENASIHRARLANLTEQQAKQACQRLAERNQPCFVFRADAQQRL